MTKRLKRPFTLHGRPRQALYDTYLSSDGVPVLLGALEHKFWKRFCEQIGRPDLIGRHSGAALEFGDDDDGLRAELETEFAKATAAQWLERFVAWDVPGPVLEIPQVMETDHFAARRIAEGEDGAWPNVTTAIRWHHTGERAGTGAHATAGVERTARRSCATGWVEPPARSQRFPCGGATGPFGIIGMIRSPVSGR